MSENINSLCVFRLRMMVYSFVSVHFINEHVFLNMRVYNIHSTACSVLLIFLENVYNIPKYEKLVLHYYQIACIKRAEGSFTARIVIIIDV